MPSSTLLQSQTDFFGFTIVGDYLATVNALLVRTLKTYPECGMSGGYVDERDRHIHSHACGLPNGHASTYVDLAIQATVRAGGPG